MKHLFFFFFSLSPLVVIILCVFNVCCASVKHYYFDRFLFFILVLGFSLVEYVIIFIQQEGIFVCFLVSLANMHCEKEKKGEFVLFVSKVLFL